jgi:hypothetical protein
MAIVSGNENETPFAASGEFSFVRSRNHCYQLLSGYMHCHNGEKKPALQRQIRCRTGTNMSKIFQNSTTTAKATNAFILVY